MARETCDICNDLIEQGTSRNECLHKAMEDVKPLIPVKAEDVKPLIPVKAEDDKKNVIFIGSIPVTIDPTASSSRSSLVFLKDVKPEDDGTLVTKTPTRETSVKSERADESLIAEPVMISNGHVSLSNEDTKEKTSGGDQENGNPLLMKPNNSKGKGKTTISASKGKSKAKAAGPLLVEPNNSKGKGKAISSASKGKGKGKAKAAGPLLIKPNNSKGKGKTTSSISKGKTKIADPVANTPRNETSTAAAVATSAADAAIAAAATVNRDTPLWFTLLALKDQETDAPLPQLPTRYLRVNNGNLPVSYLQKYVAMKLSLESEDEVELYLRSLPLEPYMLLRDLLRYWIATATPQMITTRVGASGAYYMLVLSYGRKPPPKTHAT